MSKREAFITTLIQTQSSLLNIKECGRLPRAVCRKECRNFPHQKREKAIYFHSTEEEKETVEPFYAHTHIERGFFFLVYSIFFAGF